MAVALVLMQTQGARAKPRALGGGRGWAAKLRRPEPNTLLVGPAPPVRTPFALAKKATQEVLLTVGL